MAETEQRINGLVDDIKSLKSSMPIAGSLLDLYFYTLTSSSIDYPMGTTITYKAKFIPVNPSEGLGLTEMFQYNELISSDPYWSQYNPVYLSISEGYAVNSDGAAEKTGSFIAGGGGVLKVTVAVYSTVPGHIEIEFS